MDESTGQRSDPNGSATGARSATHSARLAAERSPLQLRVLRTGFRMLARLSPDLAANAAARLFFRPRRFDPRPWELELLGGGERLTLPRGLIAHAWGNGAPVLLIHGWEGRGTQLAAFVRPLVASGRRVIALDGPAHGASPGLETHLLDFAKALLEINAVIGPLNGVVAHSFGAAAATHALARGLDAQRVVLIACPSSVRGVVERFTSALGLPASAHDRFLTLVTARVQATADELETANVARRLAIPALVVHDPDDGDVPYDDALAIAGAWKDARLLTVHGLGHRRVLRDDKIVRETVSFLTADEHVSTKRPTPAGAGR